MQPEQLIQPLDEHNLRHLGNVHPPGHVNPKPKDRYHLVVLGAGTGGLVTAAAGAALGAKVALIERHLMGGDCLNVGCVPSKGIISASRAWSQVKRASETFGAPRADGKGDFAAAMRRMRRLRADLSPIDSVQRFRGLGVDVFLGSGRLVSPDVIDVGGARLNFRRAVIATGGRPALLPIPGMAEAEPLTSETVFWLEDLPARLIVCGAGPIGCEMAQTFARFGSRVTLLNRSPRILPKEDCDAAALVETAMRRDGVEMVLGLKYLSVERRGKESVVHFERDGRSESVAADRLLVATGRTPNAEGIGLEQAGIAFGPKGVRVDDHLRTTNARVYAVGDVCSPHQFTHAADAHARLVVGNALFFQRGRASRLVMPWCTFTSPEVAHVGMYEKDAVAAGHQADTITWSIEDLDRAVLDGTNHGFVRVHLKKGTDRILGATIVADHAGDLIGELTLAVTAGVGLGTIGKTIHPYPTQGEMTRKIADAWNRRKLTPFAKRIFAIFLRIFR